MATLTGNPGTSTAKQRCLLHQIKRRKGWSDEQLHDAIGGASTTALSAQQASEAIKRLSGMKLLNPPSQKPRPCDGRRSTGAIRMITDDQVDQIVWLGLDYFPHVRALLTWLSKDFKIPFTEVASPAECRTYVRRLGTAKRAGEVIMVLKRMLERRRRKETG